MAGEGFPSLDLDDALHGPAAHVPEGVRHQIEEAAALGASKGKLFEVFGEEVVEAVAASNPDAFDAPPSSIDLLRRRDDT